MSTAVTRETFWQIGPLQQAVFWFLSAVAILFFLYGLFDRCRRYTRGQPDPVPRLDTLWTRIRTATQTVLSNRQHANHDLVAGVMHAAVVWGFLSLLVATTILAIDMDLYRAVTGESLYTGEFFLTFSFVVDLLGLVFTIGIAIAIYRRYGSRREQLTTAQTKRTDALFVWSLFLLGVGGFLLEAVRILGQAGGPQPFERASIVGYSLATGLQAVGVTPGLAATVYPVVWWQHSLVALWFVAWLPYAKPVHMLTAFATVVTRDPDAGRRLPGVPLDPEAERTAGVATRTDFTWKQLLDQDACTGCGRCTAVCPAAAAGRPLDPRQLLLDLRAHRSSDDATPVVAGDRAAVTVSANTTAIAPETAESCLACMACMEVCPVEIEQLTQITDLRRELTEQGAVAPSVQTAYENVHRHGNTFGEPQRQRPDWTEALSFDVPDARTQSVDVLWYVGEYPSYDDRNQQLARALARLLHTADLSYGILYADEGHDANDLRRTGEELLYIEQAAAMIQTIDACECDTIVCTDPHSYNTIRNEYPEIDFDDVADDPMLTAPVEGHWNTDGAIEVKHSSQLLSELLESDRLSVPASLERTVTFHDPCHLGRYNDEYTAPRTLIEATGADLYEMPRNRADAACCGGGGGGLWYDGPETTKPSEQRLREAVDDTAVGDAVDQLVVACPMCVTMYEDGRKTAGLEAEIEIVGVVELLADALRTDQPRATT